MGTTVNSCIQVKRYKFQHVVVGVEANRRVVVVVFHERLAVLSAATLEEKFTVTSCYLAPQPKLVELEQHT